MQRAAGDEAGEARTLGALADVLRGLGETEQAVECGEASLRLRRVARRPGGRGMDAAAPGAGAHRRRRRHRAGPGLRGAGRRASRPSLGEPELAAAVRELPRALGR